MRYTYNLSDFIDKKNFVRQRFSWQEVYDRLKTVDVMKIEKLGNITNNLDNKRIPLNSLQRELKSKKGLYPYIGANNIMGYIDEYIFNEKILCIAEDGGSWGVDQTCANILMKNVGSIIMLMFYLRMEKQILNI
jgi:hypothetical protein